MAASYQAVVEIANNGALNARVTACAAGEGIENPGQWANENRWKLAATPGWAEDWNYAKDTETVNQNPDIGAREDVIGDGKILAAVQVLKNAPA